jgi:hypothetical protein
VPFFLVHVVLGVIAEEIVQIVKGIGKSVDNTGMIIVFVETELIQKKS